VARKIFPPEAQQHCYLDFENKLNKQKYKMRSISSNFIFVQKQTIVESDENRFRALACSR